MSCCFPAANSKIMSYRPVKVSWFILQASPALHLQLWSAIQVTYTIISHPLIAAVQSLLLSSVQFSSIMPVHAERWSCWTEGLQGNGFVRCVFLKNRNCWESVFHFFICSPSSRSLTVLMCSDRDSHLCCDPVKTDFSPNYSNWICVLLWNTSFE